MLRWYGRGVLVLLILLTGWLSGSIGKRGSVGARLAGAGLAVYGIAKTCMEFPAAPWITLVAALAAVVLASTGRIKVPERKPGKKAAPKKNEGGKKATAKGTVGPAEKETEEPADVAKDANPPGPGAGRGSASSAAGPRTPAPRTRKRTAARPPKVTRKPSPETPRRTR